MTESTGREAKTIHRLLEMGVSDDENSFFGKGEGEPLEGDVIIIDEASMIDIMLMNSLLKAIKLGTRVIIVGDVDQLPSVGPGNVLRDLINSDFIKVVRLNDFGAFVELEPGVDGLVHISKISHSRINHPKEALTIGEEIKAKILSVDEENKRIALSIKDAE